MKNVIKLVFVSVLMIATVIISSLTPVDASNTFDSKYTDPKIWSDTSNYSADEIKLNNKAQFNIVQYINDLGEEWVTDFAKEIQIDSEVDVNPNTIPSEPYIIEDYYEVNENPTATEGDSKVKMSTTSSGIQASNKLNQIKHDKFIYSLSINSSPQAIATGWYSEGVTDKDRYTIWNRLNDSKKAAVWRLLKSAEQIELLNTNIAVERFPILTACNTYNKDDMLALWDTAKAADKKSKSQFWFRQFGAVSMFDQYRLLSYLADYNIDDMYDYMSEIGYDEDNFQIITTLLNNIISNTSSDIEDRLTEADLAIFYSSYHDWTNMSHEDKIAGAIDRVSRFAAEVNNLFIPY